MKILSIALITALTVFASCSKDDGNKPENTSRTLSYEVTGNFTGNIFASYTTASGGTVNEQIASLPWNKEITFEPGVTAAILAISGNGGASGQKAAIEIKRGGNQVGSPTNATANASGSFTVAAPVVIF